MPQRQLSHHTNAVDGLSAQINRVGNATDVSFLFQHGNRRIELRAAEMTMTTRVQRLASLNWCAIQDKSRGHICY